MQHLRCQVTETGKRASESNQDFLKHEQSDSYREAMDQFITEASQNLTTSQTLRSPQNTTNQMKKREVIIKISSNNLILI